MINKNNKNNKNSDNKIILSKKICLNNIIDLEAKKQNINNKNNKDNFIRKYKYEDKNKIQNNNKHQYLICLYKEEIDITDITTEKEFYRKNNFYNIKIIYDFLYQIILNNLSNENNISISDVFSRNLIQQKKYFQDNMNNIINNDYFELQNYLLNKLDILIIDSIKAPIEKDNNSNNEMYSFMNTKNIVDDYKYFNINFLNLLKQILKKEEFYNKNYVYIYDKGDEVDQNSDNIIPQYIGYIDAFILEKIYLIKTGFNDYINIKKKINYSVYWDDFLLYFTTIWDNLNSYLLNDSNINSLLYMPVTIDEKIVNETMQKVNNYFNKYNININKNKEEKILNLFYETVPDINIFRLLSILYPIPSIDKFEKENISFREYFVFINYIINNLFKDLKMKIFPIYRNV